MCNAWSLSELTHSISDWMEFSWSLHSQGGRKPKAYTVQAVNRSVTSERNCTRCICTTFPGGRHLLLLYIVLEFSYSSIESAHHSSQPRHHFLYASQNMSSKYAGLYNLIASNPCLWHVQWIQPCQGEICRLMWEACNQLLVPRIAVMTADWSNQ